MKKLFLLLLPCLLVLTACDTLTEEKAKDAVLRGEVDRLPLILQTVSIVEDITIDSIRLDITEEPMHGYLYTTWKMKTKETPIIVEVDSIHSSKDRSGYVEWVSRWDNATKAYFMKNFGL